MSKADADLENDLWLRVEADDLGDLKGLRLGDARLPSVEALRDRLIARRDNVRSQVSGQESLGAITSVDDLDCVKTLCFIMICMIPPI